jgi:hypothetical protein
MMVAPFPVVILNYMRPTNLTDHIIPALLNDPLVSKIIISHGNPNTVFGVSNLLDDEIRKEGKLWHVGHYRKNAEVRCFRRWEFIHTLRSTGDLPEECVLVQDDDLVFHPNELHTLYTCYLEKRGILINGSRGRNIVNNSYNFTGISGACDIVLGECIFGNVNAICSAVEEIRDLCIPTEIVQEDDIIISFFTLKDKQIKNRQHFSVPLNYTRLAENDALWLRPNHLEKRNATLKYLLDRIPT